MANKDSWINPPGGGEISPMQQKIPFQSDSGQISFEDMKVTEGLNLHMIEVKYSAFNGNVQNITHRLYTVNDENYEYLLQHTAPVGQGNPQTMDNNNMTYISPSMEAPYYVTVDSGVESGHSCVAISSYAVPYIIDNQNAEYDMYHGIRVKGNIYTNALYDINFGKKSAVSEITK